MGWSSRKDTTTVFHYPPHNPELGEDHTWVCTVTRTGQISSKDETKHGAKVDSNLRLIYEEVYDSIAIAGKTYNIKDEIKSFSDDKDVASITFGKESKMWGVTLVDRKNMHAMVIRIRTFLRACLVARAVRESEVRSEAKLAANEKKRKQAESDAKVQEINESNAETRQCRLEALQKWRLIFPNSFAGPFSSGTWYNRTVADGAEANTKCTKCKYDMLNYYGSEEWPFDSDHPPTKHFLENCHHCGFHFFYNWD